MCISRENTRAACAADSLLLSSLFLFYFFFLPGTRWKATDHHEMFKRFSLHPAEREKQDQATCDFPPLLSFSPRSFFSSPFFSSSLSIPLLACCSLLLFHHRRRKTLFLNFCVFFLEIYFVSCWGPSILIRPLAHKAD